MFTEIGDDGARKQFTYDTESRKIHTTLTADVQPNLDYATRLRNEPQYAKNGIDQSMQHIAHVPAAIVMKWMVEDGFDANKAHPNEILAKLRGNRDYNKLIVTGGKF